MKLSEILKDWPELLKKKEANAISDLFINSTIDKINENITFCDREIDREALANALYKICIMAESHSNRKVDYFISTMPTWLKPTERK